VARHAVPSSSPSRFGISHSWDATTLAEMLALLDAHQLAALVDRRHAWGVDRFDEVWEGVRHHPPVGPHSTLQQALALALRDRV
jgi:hypothetical protein